MSRGVNVLFGRKAGRIGEIQLDATISEQHEYENEVSMFPIEDGADISDHIKLKPESITLEGFVTNTPITVLYDDVSEAVKTRPGDITIKKTSREGTVNKVELTQDMLLKISGRQIQGKDTNPQIVDIVTGLRVYTGMVLTSLSIPRNNRTGQAMNFTAKFMKMVTVRSETITIPNPQPAFKNKTQSKVDKGKQTPSTSTAQITTKTSAANRAYNATIGTLGG